MKQQHTDWLLSVHGKGPGILRVGFIHNPKGFLLDVVRVHVRNHDGDETEIGMTLDEASLLATGILHVLSAVLSGVKPGLEEYTSRRNKMSDKVGASVNG